MTHSFPYNWNMRLASLSPALTEILFALGMGKCIVCTDQYSDVPDAAKMLPHLRGHVEIDPEELRSFSPEVVFTETLIQGEIAAKLCEAGFAVKHYDPRTLSEIYDSILDLGAFCERTREARELLQRMQSAFAALRKKVALLPRRPRVYIEEWHNPPMVSGNWVPEIVRAAGGDPCPLPARAPSREVSLEEVATYTPELVILSICGAPKGPPSGAGSFNIKQLLTSRSGWSELQAVKANHLFVIDDSLLNRPGPRLIEGAQRIYSWIFQVLH
jgi:iron complex transport system substrate-binding protein